MSGLGRFGLERALRELDQFAKRGGILRRDVGQDFAVQADLGGLEAFYETAVSRAGGAGARVDADLPKRAEGPLLGLAIAEGISAPMIQGIGGVTVKFGAAHAKALG